MGEASTRRPHPHDAIATVGAAWRMYQHSPDHNAVLPGNLRVNWSFDTHSKVNGGLAVSGRTLYLDTFGGELVAIDVRTGDLIWRARTGNVTMSTPIVNDDLVYIGTGRNGGGPPGAQSFAYMNTSMGNQEPWTRREGDWVRAFDARTGRQRWAYRTLGEDMPSSAIVGNRLVFANGDFHAYGLDPRTGVAHWRIALPGISTMASATPIGGNRVIVETCGASDRRDATIAIDVAHGKLLWTARLGNCDAAATSGDGRIFVSGVDGTQTHFGFGGRSIVAALSPSTGATLWVYRDLRRAPYTSVGSSERAVAGTFADHRYFQSLPTADALIAFNPVTGVPLWRFSTMAPVKMSPLVVAGCLYFGDTSGIFYILNEHTGVLVRATAFKMPFATSPPVILGDTMFFVNGSVLYARRDLVRTRGKRLLCAA